MTKFRWATKQAGFTIVELLIVIVIIAILAAITVVAYNGIQDRASRSAAASDVAKALKKVELFRINTGSYPTSITACPTPSAAELCLSASSDGEWAYSTGGTSEEPSAMVASMNSRRFTLKTIGEMQGTNEFVRTFDTAPMIDKYGRVEYRLQFDIRSADSSIDNTTQVYMQNGSGARYTFSQSVTVTDTFERKNITFTPTLANASFAQSYLAFYGTYNTGNRPIVRNIELSLAQ